MNRISILTLACTFVAGCATAGDNGDVATYDTLKIARETCAARGEVLVLKTDGDPQRSSAYECRKKP